MLVVAPIVYLNVAWMMHNQGRESLVGSDIAFYLLLVVAIFSPLIIPIITRGLIKAERAIKDKTRSPGAFFQSLSIVHMAFVEAIYVYGFVVFMLTGRLDYMLYFYPIAVAWSFVYWPRREKFNRLLEKLDRP